MNLYTLDENFAADGLIDEYVSAIWTERYSTAGDFQLVVAKTPDNLARFKTGTRLACEGSKDLMVVETTSLEPKLLTVTGPSLIKDLNSRIVWEWNAQNNGAGWQPTDVVPPDQRVTYFYGGGFTSMGFIRYVVLLNCVVGEQTWSDARFAAATIDYAHEPIVNLSVVSVDDTGLPVLDWQIDTGGGVYDAIEQLASQNELGIRLSVADVNPTATDVIDRYSLPFEVYRGLDRTTDQEANDVVRLSLAQDGGLDNGKELQSRANYKNIAYVYMMGITTKHLADPMAPEPLDWDRRVLMIKDSSTYPDSLYTGPIRAKLATDALANNNYVHVVDGQASPFSMFKYGTDYGLGDIVELESFTGFVSKARVTEYIRSADANGVKGYPTISVLS